jgi:hypothetical protein
MKAFRMAEKEQCIVDIVNILNKFIVGRSKNMKCSNCETELATGLRYCPHCGERIAADSPEENQSHGTPRKTIISTYFLNNLEYVKVLCLLQAVDGCIDKEGIMQKFNVIIHENSLAKEINIITGVGISTPLSTVEAVKKTEEVITNTEHFCEEAKNRFLGSDDMCDVLMEALYESENKNIYHDVQLSKWVKLTQASQQGNTVQSGKKGSTATKVTLYHYLDDLLLWLIQYAKTNDLYLGMCKRFIQHLARKWRIQGAIYANLEKFATSFADIEKKRQKIRESDEPYKTVENVLADLNEQEESLTTNYYQKRDAGFPIEDEKSYSGYEDNELDEMVSMLNT